MELKLNAYNILWLDSGASNKEINKRYKEIEKYLNFNEIPSYDNDLKIIDYEEVRTLDYIKDAFEILSNSNDKIVELFFWFQINDARDEEAMFYIKKWNYKKALNIWKELYETNKTSKRYFYLKNFLILFFIKSQENDELDIEEIKNTVQFWKKIIDSESYWKLFKSYFDWINDNSNFNLTELIKEDIKKNLSSLYINLWESVDDLTIFWDFSTKFNLSISSIEHNIMDEIYKNIQLAVESLEELDISADWVFDNEEKRIVKESIFNIQEALNKTIDLWFYEDSKILLYRDRGSIAIRKIVLDLHNNLDEKKKSLSLLKIANEICWTDNLKDTIQKDINQIESNIIEEENSVVRINIPCTFWHNKELIFKSDLLEYNWKVLKFNEIDGTSFYSVKNSINWITTWTNYNIYFYASGDVVNLNFSSGMFNSWSEEKWDIFWKIFTISKWIIEPLIIQKIKNYIFHNNWEYKIWWITFTKRWYFKKKFFWWEDWVFWDEKRFWIPEYSQWTVRVYKVEDWKVKNFDSISMGTKNAVILPEMIPEFFNYYQSNL